MRGNGESARCAIPPIRGRGRRGDEFEAGVDEGAADDRAELPGTDNAEANWAEFTVDHDVIPSVVPLRCER